MIKDIVGDCQTNISQPIFCGNEGSLTGNFFIVVIGAIIELTSANVTFAVEDAEVVGGVFS